MRQQLCCLSSLNAEKFLEWEKHETFLEDVFRFLDNVLEDFIARAPADGYTFAVVFDTHGVNPSLNPSMPYDTRKDLVPLVDVVTDNTGTPEILAKRGLDYESLRQLNPKVIMASVSGFGRAGAGLAGCQLSVCSSSAAASSASATSSVSPRATSAPMAGTCTAS